MHAQTLPAPAAAQDAATCFHCGLPVPAGSAQEVVVDGRAQPMCCPGCAAVCRAILDAGLGDYYRHRTLKSGEAAVVLPDRLIEAGVYDLPAVQRSFVSEAADGTREASLVLDGIVCAACAWLNERQLRGVPGVTAADVNFATHRARVVYDPARTTLSDILAAVRRVGYRAWPYDPARRERQLEQERRQRLRALGIAGVLGLQVMMMAVALYMGDWTGMQPGIRRLLEWASLVLATPLMVVCARPFFAGALRDLRARSPGMDVPVSLGLGVAFAGSVHATVTGVGQVYYDSLCTFVFLLLLARYLEFAARHRAAVELAGALPSTPDFATLLDTGGAPAMEQVVPVAELRTGDHVLVRPGETVPADGEVVAGSSTVDEALLSGENRPVAKRVGENVIGGSVNVYSPLQVRVQRVGADTVLSQIVRLAERAGGTRPPVARVADGIAGVFVGVVLVLACVAGWWWWRHDPAHWLPVVVSVLVVSCPCALSLATPSALTVGSAVLARLGLLVTRSDTLEALARVDRVAFDKTGTLTRGRLRLTAVHVQGGMPAARCLAVAAALERHSEHPLGHALLEAEREARPRDAMPLVAEEVVNVPGEGLSGSVGGQRYRLGAPAHGTGGQPGGRTAGTAVELADEQGVQAVFVFEDELRPGAPALLAGLAALGVQVSLLSGDGGPEVERVAEALGITDYRACQRPQDKLAWLRERQERGEMVAMVGDGVNDAPVLAAAQVSIAMQGGAQLARASAGALFVGERLVALAEAVATARATLAVVRQNLLWALVYNALALPAAMIGWVAPWLAAIGMSASSLVVVANAVRLSRRAHNVAVAG